MGKEIKNIINTMVCFTRKNLETYFKGKINTFNAQIKYAIKNGNILKLKNGLYISREFYDKEPNKTGLTEYIAYQLKNPSYLSLEYVMQKYNLLTEGTYLITSITKKTRNIYKNLLGTFKYSNIKDELYFGFDKKQFGNNIYYEANKSKAIFDYLYLKRNIGSKLKEEILEGLRINWINFSIEDFKLFNQYCQTSKSKKMIRIANILKNNIYKL